MSAVSALDRLASRGVSAPGERGIDVPLEKIKFDPSQPRKAYHHLDGRVTESDEAYIAELAQTIEENGLIQAITVQEMGDGTYQVVVGECRTRAHLLLGKKTIRAVVRNDLSNPSRRLVYQIIENVTRKKLSDQELADSVQILKKGGDGVEPMSQVQIAKTLGKSDAWVSRFVRFGDEELQRLWVKSGIADSVEHLYRLSILPVPMQVDIRRRVELPESDFEWLEKPLLRATVDRLTKEAKAWKKPSVPPVSLADLSRGGAPVNDVVDKFSSGGELAGSGSGAGSEGLSQSAGAGSGSVGQSDSLDRGGVVVAGDTTAPDVMDGVASGAGGMASPGMLDGVSAESHGRVDKESDGQVDGLVDGQAQAAALAAAVVDGHVSSEPAVSAAAGSLADSDGKYQLREDARAAILGSAGLPSSLGGAVSASEQMPAPVFCRIPLGRVVALLDLLQTNADMRSAMDAVQCELSIPGNLAQLVANQLAGIIVDRKEVPALMQRELVKLGQLA